MLYEIMCIACGFVFKSEDVNEALQCPKCDSYAIDTNMRGV